MSWIYNDWTQDDSVNFGFPYASSSVPAQADFSEVKSVMKLKQNQNFGFPFINEVSSIDYDNVRTAWKIDPDVNFGFPYTTIFKLDDEWICPIIDRNFSDIKNANKNSNRKKHNPAIEFEFTKAYLNYTDLNRIENNTKYLSKELSETVTVKLDWAAEKIPLVSDRTRILQNMDDIRSKFLETYPEIELETVPTKLSTYADFNQLENVQLQIYETISESGE